MRIRILKRIKNWIIYRLILLAIGIVDRLPRQRVLNLGVFLGKVSYFLLSGARRQTIENLKVAFKSKDQSQLKKLATEVFENLGKNAVDAIKLRNANWEQLKHIVEVDGISYFDQAYRLGRGLVALTGHIGNFELIPTYFSQAGYKVSVVGRELYDKRLDKLLLEARFKAGIQTIPTTAQSKEVIRALKSGRALGVLVDQDSFRVRGIFVDFFGRPAKTPIGPFLLARRMNSPIMPLAITRKEDGNYRIIIKEEIRSQSQADKDKQIAELTQKGTGFLEEVIREHPSQWAWMHRRWASKPENEDVV